MKIGYAFIPRDGTHEKPTGEKLVSYGAEKVFVDLKSRKWLRDPIFIGSIIREDDHLILLSAEGIVDEVFDIDDKPKSYRRMKADFRKVLKPLAALNVTISVRDGPAVLYDTNETIDQFIDLAVTERHKRSSAAGGAGKKRKRGRPIKYFATEEQKRAICIMWWDKAISRDTVRANATEMVGWNVTDNVIKSWCGPKREKPDG